MEKKMQFLRKPEGFKDLLPEEAALKRRCEDTLSRLFDFWGYREVVPPMVEYSGIFTAGLKTDFEDKLYRFSDEQGRTLVLRPDLTLPLARMVATHMKNEPLPLRCFYQGSIFRYLPAKTGRQREFLQAGVELVGMAGPLADAELISLAAASLLALGITDFKICLGNLGFLNSFLDRRGLKEEERERIKKHLSQKDLVALEGYVESLSLGRDMKDDILRISRLKGGKEVLSEIGELFRDSSAVREMKTLMEILDSLGTAPHVLVDLGLVRGLDYYTGIVFDGYAGSLGSPICGGGRYDRLFSYFGRDLAAVGFAFSIENVLLLLGRQGASPPCRPKTLVAFCPELQREGCMLASRLREGGTPVEMALKPMTLEESRSYALARGIKGLRYMKRQGEEITCVEEEL